MIPKILYCIWISTEPIPEKFQNYIKTWKDIMPDYEIKYITIDNIIKNDFTVKAIEQKKYALAGHYARHQMLYENGGIYLDLDIEVVKRFDDLLNEKCFLGREDDKMIDNAVMGSEAGNEFHLACMKELDNFDTTEEYAELKTGPWLVNRMCKDYDVKIFPEEYFYPYHYTKQFTPECVKENTYTIHHWVKSWGK